MSPRRLGIDDDAVAVLIVRLFVLAVFTVIAVIGGWMGVQVWHEVRARTSDSAQTGTFAPAHCEHHRRSAECTGTFTADGGGTAEPAKYRATSTS